LAREERTGVPARAGRWGAATALLVAGVGFLATGLPLTPNTPEIITSGTNIQRYEGGLSITPQFAAVLIALVTYTGSFIAEIVRGSIQALPNCQGEAAAALGLSAYQRMTLVVLPQALRSMIPPLTNQYLNLTKNSSLAVVIGYSELFFISTVVINNAGHAVPMFVLVIGTYQALNLLISLAMNSLNTRVQLVGR
ncbi:MAG: ABC transporter permease subunit, partial [Chloroflexi bacterium]|nr:ABC transporter permease subunit [Chloroflexota bacterium]